MPLVGIPDSTSHEVGSAEGVRMSPQDCMTLKELAEERGISLRAARRLARNKEFGPTFRHAGRILVIRDVATGVQPLLVAA